MTDNEKRAHELTLAYLTVTELEDQNFYELYCDMYHSFLTRINEDFKG